jgi:rhamnosyltransferase
MPEFLEAITIFLKCMGSAIMLSVIIPTYNAENYMYNLLTSLKGQSMACEILVVDSSSADDTVRIAESFDVTTLVIKKEDFDHGRTRTFAGKETHGDIVVYLTQDALPLNKFSLEKLVKVLGEDERLGATFGRQIPFPDAPVFGAHLRLYNYPAESYVVGLQDKDKYGIKTPFLSNAFAAYKRKVLEEIGWFKDNLILSEDTYAGAKMLMAGYKLAYVADALVYHSHSYSLKQEFKRYFDIGAFHRIERWILNTFGNPRGEGINYVISEIKYLIHNGKHHLIFEAMLKSVGKYLGYEMGYNHRMLPNSLVRALSMNRDWWNSNGKRAPDPSIEEKQ